MSLYLYLNEHWHADTWVGGGSIPIKPASTYRTVERSGVFTPDENLIHKSEVDLRSLEPHFCFGPGIQGVSIIGFNAGGVLIPDIHEADLYEEDGGILSFSWRLTASLARKMKKTACVKILDMPALKAAIDGQLGVASRSGYCEYTEGHERNHYLKSELDRWQAEYRLFWPITEQVEVVLPPGLAEHIRKW
ncbi:hypothetical protein EI534_07670 [Pseudomonas frederiksbergensis]|nr:hypothetical protein [Pseudomonas frederiksbergensis]